MQKTTNILKGLINIVFTIVNIGLVIRFLLRLFGANTASGFTQFVYTSTAPLLSPFRGIFTPYVVNGGYVLEFSTLIATVVYSMLSWLLIELIHFVAEASKK